MIAIDTNRMFVLKAPKQALNRHVALRIKNTRLTRLPYGQGAGAWVQVTGFDIPHRFPEDYVSVFGMDVPTCVASYNQCYSR